jgi:hypothetical protein
VPLTADYELVTLMEMAMSRNKPYLNQFQADLRTNRFDLIVASGMNPYLAQPGSVFGEENDAWAVGVARPFLCMYRVAADFTYFSVYVPRAEPCR